MLLILNFLCKLSAYVIFCTRMKENSDASIEERFSFQSFVVLIRDHKIWIFGYKEAKTLHCSLNARLYDDAIYVCGCGLVGHIRYITLR